MKSPPTRRPSGPKRKPGQRKSADLRVPCTTRERDLIFAHVARLGTDFAPWARGLFFQEVGKGKTP